MQNIPLTLGAGQHWQAPFASHLCILCEEGVLWVSYRGEANDYFLQAGESLVLNGRRDVIVGPAPAVVATARARVIYQAAARPALMARFFGCFAKCLWQRPTALAPTGMLSEKGRVSC